MIQVVNEFRSGETWSVEVTDGKSTVSVYRGKTFITTCVRNASNKAWNRGVGGGKSCQTMQQAVDSYKKEATKEMIRFAFDHMERDAVA